MGLAKIVGIGAVAVIGTVVVVGMLGTATSIISAPGRVIQETLKTGNIINNYEMFFDINAGYQRRLGDIAGHAAAVESATGDEKNRLTVELLGMRNTCRDLVTRYNAESSKQNRALFKAADLPAELDINSCN